MTLNEQISRLKSIFQGNSRWRGFMGARLEPEAEDPSKINNPSRGFAPGPVTEGHWLAHLEGKEGLGVVPITDYQECSFMAIDLDLSLMEELQQTPSGMNEKVMQLALPLVVCRSKSGGAHLYVFFKELVEVASVRPTFVTIADILGLRSRDGVPVEIYPHTSKLDMDSKGKYINMPYFDANDTQRFAYGQNGGTLSLTDFLLLAEKKSVTRKQFLNWTAPISGEDSIRSLVVQGPPCLQTLFDMGIPEGTRNDMLFQFGIMFKKAVGAAKFEDYTEWVSNNKASAPLPSGELDSLLRGIKKKDYHYNCAHQCMAKICQKDICAGRKYGIRGKVDFPSVKKILQWGDDNEQFEIHFDEGAKILRITAADLLNFERVQSDMLQLHHIVIPTIKKMEWLEFVRVLVTKIERIIVPVEFRIEHRIRSVIMRMATSRAMGTKLEDLLVRKPVRLEEGKVLISHKEIKAEISKHRWQDYLDGMELPVIMEDMQGGFKTVTVGNEKMGVVWIPDPEFNHEQALNAVKTEFTKTF